MGEDQEFARLNYEAHRLARASAYPYPPIPSWEHLPETDRAAWVAGAEAVRVRVNEAREAASAEHLGIDNEPEQLEAFGQHVHTHTPGNPDLTGDLEDAPESEQ